ncbi:hypothetical protein AB3S75_022167 [Citrus x aurantiifolia]
MKDLSQDQLKQSIIALCFILSPVYFSLFHILMEWCFSITGLFASQDVGIGDYLTKLKFHILMEWCFSIRICFEDRIELD